MPKRKWNRLHDEWTIASERHHRSRQLNEQREARVTIDEAVADLQDEPPPEPPPAPEPPKPRRTGE